MVRRTSLRSPPERLILGIDPGLAITGYAVLQQRQADVQLLVCDVIRTPKQTPLPDRLQSLYEQLTTLLTTYHPTEAAMERLFFGKNRKTAIEVSHARCGDAGAGPGSSFHCRVQPIRGKACSDWIR